MNPLHLHRSTCHAWRFNSYISALNAVRKTERGLDIHIDQDGLPNCVDLGYNAFKIERLREDNLEYLLDVDRGSGRAEDKRCMHGFRKPLGLLCDLLLLVWREICEYIELGADEERYCGLRVQED